MRLLLDECVDQGLCVFFEPHECYSAGYAGLAGLKNGALLTAAGEAGFEGLITTDQEIPHQQNLAARRISIVILCAPTNRMADLERLAPEVLLALESIAPGQVVRIKK